MLAIHHLDMNRYLWKSHPTPFDIHIRKIMREKKDHPLYEDFLELYRSKRNHLVTISVEEVSHRRKSGKSRRSPRPKFAVENVLHDLKFLMFAMNEGILTKDICNLVQLTVPDLPNRYEIQIVNMAKTTKDLMKRRYLYSSSKDSEMQNWYDYIRKIMGIYNVPRDDLAQRHERKIAAEENRKACIQRANEIIEAKGVQFKRYPPTVTMYWPISEAELNFSKTWLNLIRDNS